MNIEKIAVLLGQLQTMIEVFDELSPSGRNEVRGTLKRYGIDTSLVANNVVKAKQQIQGIPAAIFEPLVAISSDHLAYSTRQAMLDGHAEDWGVVTYTNAYGGFFYTGMPIGPNAPACVRALCAWASDRGITWVKVDADAPLVDGLARYGDGDVAMTTENGLVSAAS